MRLKEKNMSKGMVTSDLSLPFLWERVVENWMKEVSAQSSFLQQLIAQGSTFKKLGIHYQWFEVTPDAGYHLIGVQFNFPLGGSQAYLCYETKTFHQTSHYAYQPVSNRQFYFQQQREISKGNCCQLSLAFNR